MKRYLAASGLVVLTLGLAPSTPVGAATPAAPVSGRSHQPTLTGLLDQLVVAGAPGAAVLLDDGRRVETVARGLAEVRRERPMRPRSNYRAGSVTKPMVATVVLQLVDEGRLSLDDTVQDWLPGILPYADRVTVRHLLTMSSGVPDHLDARFMTGLYDSWAGRLRTWAPRELVALSASRPLSFAPGTGFEYSNTNYVLAGLIVEAVTGRSLGRELTRRVFQPLGLRNTSFPVTWPAIPGPSAHGYSLPLDPNQGPVEGDLVDMTLLNPSFAWAAGNVVSDVDDLTRFLSGLLTGRLLPPALLAEMKTGVDAGDPTVQYGMGIQTIQTPCGPVLGHDGAIPGFVTMVLATEDGRRHFALMMNQYFVGPDLFAAFSATVGELMRRLFPGEECAGTGAGRAAPFAAPAPTLSRSISWSFR